MHAALFLVLAFFTSAAIWMQLQAEFLAITLVLVYVGAVMVLFLFVVMMLDINLARLRAGFWSYLPLGARRRAAAGRRDGAHPGAGYFAGLRRHAGARRRCRPGYSNTKELGRLLYTEYVYPFEIAAVILLVAIVSAIALTLRRRKQSKYIDPAQQIAVRRQDRVRIVSMPSEKRDRIGTGIREATAPPRPSPLTRIEEEAD